MQTEGFSRAWACAWACTWACASGVVLRCIRVLGRTTLVHVFVDRLHTVRVCVLMCACARCVAAGGALGERRGARVGVRCVPSPRVWCG